MFKQPRAFNFKELNLPACVFLLFLLLGIAFASAIIFAGSGTAPLHPMDQGFVYVDLQLRKSEGYWQFQYPRLQWAGGITASLIVGSYRLLVFPSVETLNWHVKIFTACLYVGSAGLLFWATVRDSVIRLLCLATVVTSGYFLLEPSSELIAGALFSLFLFSAWRGNVKVGAIFLALFGLAKVELALSSAVILAVWAFTLQTKAERTAVVAVFVFILVVLIFPSAWLYGWDAVGGGRGFDAFSQHFSALRCKHNLNECVALGLNQSQDAWKNHHLVTSQLLPGASNLFEVLTRYPQAYAHHVWLSARESFQAVLFALHGWLFLLLFAIVRERSTLLSRRKVKYVTAVLLVCIVAWLPALLLAFIHVRYIARFYPAIIVAVILLLSPMLEECEHRNFRAMVVGTLAAMSLGQILWLLPAIAMRPHSF